MKLSEAESKNLLVAALSGASSLVSAALALIRDAGQLPPLIRGMPPEGWWAIAALLCIAAILKLAGVLSKKSRVRDPSAFTLDVENPRHLVGRDDDLRKLSKLVHRFPFVLLEGESGAGKSALVRCLAVSFPKGSPIVPVYLVSYSGDWAAAPRFELAACIWHSLSVEERQQLGLVAITDIEKDPFSYIARFRDLTGRTCVLIFDQFDDYLVEHRVHLQKDGCWISPRELTRQNAFWRRVSSLLLKNQLRIMIVTRSDMMGGVEPFRFLSPIVHPVLRPHINALTLIFDRIASADGVSAVENEGAGWPALRERLIRDLNEEGTVFPVRLRLLLKGLTSLSYLSVSTYEAAGGNRGLEQLHIGNAINAAARISNTTKEAVVAVLSELIDHANIASSKTIARPLSSILDTLRKKVDQNQMHNPQVVAEKAELLLNTLCAEGITRERLEVGSGDTHWALYHDYLVPLIRDTREASQRWTNILRDNLSQHRAAGTLIARWKTLLSIRAFASVLMLKLRRRISLGEARNFVLLSSLRLLPPLGLIYFCAYLGNQYLWSQAEKRAALALVSFNIREQGFSATQVQRIRSTFGYRERVKLVELALNDPWYASQFTRNSDVYLALVLGFQSDEALRRHLQKMLMGVKAEASLDCLRVVATFGTEMTCERSSESVNGRVLDAVARLIRSGKIYNNTSFENWIKSLSKDNLQKLVNQTFDPPVPGEAWSGIKRLAECLDEQLGPGEPNFVVDRIVDRFLTSAGAGEQNVQAGVLVLFKNRLTEEQRKAVTQRLLATASISDAVADQEAVSEKIKILATGVNAKAAEDLVSKWFELYDRERDADDALSRSFALATLGGIDIFEPFIVKEVLKRIYTSHGDTFCQLCCCIRPDASIFATEEGSKLRSLFTQALSDKSARVASWAACLLAQDSAHIDQQQMELLLETLVFYSKPKKRSESQAWSEAFEAIGKSVEAQKWEPLVERVLYKVLESLTDEPYQLSQAMTTMRFFEAQVSRWSLEARLRLIRYFWGTKWSDDDDDLSPRISGCRLVYEAALESDTESAKEIGAELLAIAALPGGKYTSSLNSIAVIWDKVPLQEKNAIGGEILRIASEREQKDQLSNLVWILSCVASNCDWSRPLIAQMIFPMLNQENKRIDYKVLKIAGDLAPYLTQEQRDVAKRIALRELNHPDIYSMDEHCEGILAKLIEADSVAERDSMTKAILGQFMESFDSERLLKLSNVLQSCRSEPQAVVDALKHPLAVGEIERNLLKMLSRSSNEVFTSRAEYARWAKQRRVKVDL